MKWTRFHSAALTSSLHLIYFNQFASKFNSMRRNIVGFRDVLLTLTFLEVKSSALPFFELKALAFMLSELKSFTLSFFESKSLALPLLALSFIVPFLKLRSWNWTWNRIWNRSISVWCRNFFNSKNLRLKLFLFGNLTVLIASFWIKFWNRCVLKSSKLNRSISQR